MLGWRGSRGVVASAVVVVATPTGSIAIHLRYTGGTTPTVKVETAASGDITAVTAPSTPLPVTLTKVAAC